MKKTMFKVTPKTTKAQLLEVLTANAQNTEGIDQQTLETAAYAVKNPDKATRSDLTSLVKSFMSALGDKLIVPAFAESNPKTEAQPESKPEAPKAENLLKKGTGPKPEKTLGVSKTDKADEPKKPSKSEGADGKPSEKKGAAKKSNTLMASAADFPESITIGKKTFNIVHGNLTMKDLNRNDVEFEFCFWWTKRHLKQFPYFQGLLPHPDEFPNNLDYTQLYYVSDEGKVAYTVSDITDAPYVILPKDLEELDGVRVAGGIEYAIYSAPADPETPEEDPESETEEDPAE